MSHFTEGRKRKFASVFQNLRIKFGTECHHTVKLSLCEFP